MSYALPHSAMWMSAIVLVMLCGGCGSSVPDESGSLQSRPMVNTSQTEKASTSHSLPVGEPTIVEKKIEGNVTGSAPVDQFGNQSSASSSSIPLSVAKDLLSLEARDRYRALDHWETEDSKAPLDPVFEAMEDDDPAVRAKATAIVEQYWAAEQEREKQ